MNKQTIKCAVFALNSNGEPEVFFVNVTGPEESIYNGDHYDAAKDAAENHGFDAVMACDENDPAWAHLAYAETQRPDECVTLPAPLGLGTRDTPATWDEIEAAVEAAKAN